MFAGELRPTRRAWGGPISGVRWALVFGVLVACAGGRDTTAVVSAATSQVQCLERTFGNESPRIVRAEVLPPAEWCSERGHHCSEVVSVVVAGRYVPYRCVLEHDGVFRCSFDGSHPEPLQRPECESP